jgi:uncharacterized protein (DUF362 family)
MKRRNFIKTSAIGAIGAGLLPITATGQVQESYPDVVRVKNGEPDQLLPAALAALGGMSHFISKGDVVVVKPNMGWDRSPKYAANTNPELVAEIVKSCYNAGAKEVKVFDRTCNNPRRCYRNSKIEEKAKDAGADVFQIRKNKFVSVKLKNGKTLKEWSIYKDYLEADKTINVPIAKHHSLCHVTLGLKNLMGVMGDNRGSIHSGFDIKLADINEEILPTLTIIDAYRVLASNGPSGGNLSDVTFEKTLIASSCVVAADILGLDLFSLSYQQVGHIREMVDRKLNKFDVNKLKIKDIDLSS